MFINQQQEDSYNPYYSKAFVMWRNDWWISKKGFDLYHFYDMR